LGPPLPLDTTADPCQGIEDESGYLDTVPYWRTPLEAGDRDTVQGYPTTLPGVMAAQERPSWLFTLKDVVLQLSENVTQVVGQWMGWPACFFGHPPSTSLLPLDSGATCASVGQEPSLWSAR